MNFDGRPKNAIKSKPPLAELSLKLTDKDGRSLKISGIVPEGQGLEAAPSVVEQNGGVCVVEGKYLKMISFPSLGFEVEYPQFYKKGGLPFKIENGRVVWSSLADTKIKGKTFMEIKDDRKYTKDMPDIINKLKGFLLGKEKKCEGGGCGGSKEEEDILTSPALALALANPNLEFSYNPNNGEISILQAQIRNEFLYSDEITTKPGDPPGMGFAIPQVSFLPSFYDPGADNSNFGQIPISDEREVHRRKRMEVGDKISTIFFEYSKNYFLRTAAENFKGSNAEFNLPGIILPYPQEESMIIRLLMNPTERKIWGKMYGLPDEDNARSSLHIRDLKINEIKQNGEIAEQINGDIKRKKHAPEKTQALFFGDMKLANPKEPESSYPKTKPMNKPMESSKERTYELHSSSKKPKQRSMISKTTTKMQSQKRNFRTPKQKVRKYRSKDGLTIEIPPDNKLKRKKSKLSKADISVKKSKAKPKDKKGIPKQEIVKPTKKPKQKTRSKTKAKPMKESKKQESIKARHIRKKTSAKQRKKSKTNVINQLIGLFRQRSGARSSRQRQSM
jgi:hypothetical protein